MSNMQINDVLAQMRAMAARVESPAEAPGGSAAVGKASGAEFGDMLRQAINQVNDVQQNASQMADAYVAGTGEADLAQVMVALQKANVSFQAMTQVRNRLVSAYQDIFNMPV